MLLGIFVFIFIAWIATGGPARPISFAGPYITPVTDVGERSEGYGSIGDTTIGKFYSDTIYGGNNYLSPNELQGQLNDIKEDAADSTYKNSVQISGGRFGGEDEDDEYVTLTTSGNTSVDITGWVIRSSSKKAVVPQGKLIAWSNGSGALINIVLSPGETAYINTGKSPLNTSFKENACSGYLGARYDFTPSISYNACPSPEDELRTFYTGDANSYVACKTYLENTSGECGDTSGGVAPSSCRLFIAERLNYSGCLIGHQNDTNFILDTWRIYLNERDPLWRGRDATLRLYDSSGNLVDVYEY